MGEALQVVRRRLGIVALCAVLAPGSALALSLLQSEEYSTEASLLFRSRGVDVKLFQSSAFDPSVDPDREAETNLTLVSSDVVAERTARRVGGGLTAGEVSDKVQVTGAGPTNVMSIKATDAVPRTAAKLADTFAHEYIAFRGEADRAKVRESQRLVRAQLDSLAPSENRGPHARSLHERAEQLEVLASLQTGNAELVQQAAIPSSPSSPRPMRNALIGLLLGICLGSAAAFVLHRMDRRIRDPREAEAIFERPILGAIANRPSLAADNPSPMSNEEAEPFRMVRANLRYFNVDTAVRSVLVSSATPGDGKSTVSWNLAAAGAAAGAKVLLIEADLRHPVFVQRYQLPPLSGLSSVLAGEQSPDRAILSVPIAADGSGLTVDVIPAGPLPPNPADLMDSERMESLVRLAEETYDLVVIDTPPVSIVSDAVPLMGVVSGLLVVCRLGKTPRDAARHLHRHLQNLGAPTIGLVANGVDEDGGYAYG